MKSPQLHTKPMNEKDLLSQENERELKTIGFGTGGERKNRNLRWRDGDRVSYMNHLTKPKLKKIQVQQKRSLLNKLSDHDYTRPWTRARRQCVVSTGQWLIQVKQFSSWVSDPASSLLCLTGKSES